MEDFKIALKLVCFFVIVNLVFYLLGAFITWDWNVMNWLLFKDWQGRFFLVCVELLIMVPACISVLGEQES